LLAGADPKTAFDPNGLFYDLEKALAERVRNANRQACFDSRPIVSTSAGSRVRRRDYLDICPRHEHRKIVGHLRYLYAIDVSADLISAVTDAVLEEVAAWQARPWEAVHPLVFVDALRDQDP
jgi:putative transposase